MVRSGYCPNGTRQKCRSKWNCWILLCRLSSVTDPVRKTISYSLISTTGLSANLWKRGWKSADNKGYFISVLKLLNGRNLIRQKIRLLTAIFHFIPRVCSLTAINSNISAWGHSLRILSTLCAVPLPPCVQNGSIFSRTNHNRTGNFLQEKTEDHPK